MPQLVGIFCLQNDVPHLCSIGSFDATQHFHEVALDVNLEQIDRGQTMDGNLARDRCATDLMGNQFALLAQFADPRQL